MRKMTQKAYVKAHGQVCPHCKGHDISGRSVDIDGNTATQEVGCLDCNAEWTDVYQLTGYERLVKA